MSGDAPAVTKITRADYAGVRCVSDDPDHDEKFHRGDSENRRTSFCGPNFNNLTRPDGL